MGRTARGLAAVHISIHALREEGDHSRQRMPSASWQFLSTPSARRATERQKRKDREMGISIHALREEGDTAFLSALSRTAYFYPRPPRGGRLHAALHHRVPQLISIHALREEGDALSGGAYTTHRMNFYPRPPRGGRLQGTAVLRRGTGYFYPRPPRGGRLVTLDFDNIPG